MIFALRRPGVEQELVLLCRKLGRLNFLDEAESEAGEKRGCLYNTVYHFS
jgi:hypothetical protein